MRFFQDLNLYGNVEIAQFQREDSFLDKIINHLEKVETQEKSLLEVMDSTDYRYP